MRSISLIFVMAVAVLAATLAGPSAPAEGSSGPALQAKAGKRPQVELAPSSISFWNRRDGVFSNGSIFATCDPPGSKGSGLVRVTRDGGTTFRTVLRLRVPIPYVETAGRNDIWVESVDCSEGTKSYESARTWHSPDRGRSWEILPALGIFKPSFATRRLGIASTYHPTCQPEVSACISYTSDGGQSWEDRPSPCTGGGALKMATPTDVWALCYQSGYQCYTTQALYHSSDGGQTWALIESADETPFRLPNIDCPFNFDFTPDGFGLFLGYQATPRFSPDGGHHWKRVGQPLNRHLLDAADLVSRRVRYAVQEVSPRRYKAAGDFARLLFTRDGGRTWFARHRWLIDY